MSKKSSLALGVSAAGLIAVSPAVAAGLIAPTNTRSGESMPTSTAVVAPTSTDQPDSGIIDGRRQSPLLVPKDSKG